MRRSEPSATIAHGGPTRCGTRSSAAAPRTGLSLSARAAHATEKRITLVRGQAAAIVVRLAGRECEDVEVRVSADGVAITEGNRVLTAANPVPPRADYRARQIAWICQMRQPPGGAMASSCCLATLTAQSWRRLRVTWVRCAPVLRTTTQLLAKGGTGSTPVISSAESSASLPCRHAAPPGVHDKLIALAEANGSSARNVHGARLTLESLSALQA
jgi:hypothetical protein